ncbi:hypothetical protein HOK68_04685 [Candidatus Woesearchaeota archaeon]|jgi:hypothetical protein|nr:hypothetical protein [Candidatus Woesearchaeota archaeon]MBT4595685.1 hypothetical protein [Candidatus Woesearchaeota archaeon]MBT5740696.1 hypothetical protein [Candidatus Woesearchaeota archaeon]MBT6506044.1 hypothetical protein [Candidatus Woesearchaeota archaeon]MBT7296923.1 hypothetical protein [Candidatus Woesearchaeota archaeon]
MKKAQINHTFAYISAIVLIAITAILLISGINIILNKSNDLEISKFSNNIIKDVSKHSKLFGAETDINYDVPNSIDKIYFIDTKRVTFLNCNISKYANIPFRIRQLIIKECFDKINHNERHTLFFSGVDYFDQLRAGNIFLSGETILILPVNKKLGLHFEGRGGKTEVNTIDSDQASYSIPRGTLSSDYTLSSKSNSIELILTAGNSINFASGLENIISLDSVISKYTSSWVGVKNNKRQKIIFKSDIFNLRPFDVNFLSNGKLKLKYNFDLDDSEHDRIKLFIDGLNEWKEVDSPIVFDEDKNIAEFEINKLGSYVIALISNEPPALASCENSDCVNKGGFCCENTKGIGNLLEEYSNIGISGKRCFEACLD